MSGLYILSTQAMSAQATGLTGGLALAGNQARVGFFIQNVGANPMYVFYGQTAASAANFHEILAAGTAALDGKGGLIREFGPLVYNGPVSVGGTAAAYVAYEIAP